MLQEQRQGILVVSPLRGYALYKVFDANTLAVKVLSERSRYQLRVQSGLITVGVQQKGENWLIILLSRDVCLYT